MAYKTKQIQSELKSMTRAAVENGVKSPDDLRDYLIDNGWKYEIPTRPTLISALNSVGVEFIHGYWEQVR